MKPIIQLRNLKGYNHNLEIARQEQFGLLMSSTNTDEQRSAARRMASLTALRSRLFIGAMELALGLRDD